MKSSGQARPFDIKLANPRGFCAGVDRAIEIVNRALERYGAPIYVRHEVVHNRTVVGELHERGAIFVDELEEVPEGALVIFSAHGVSKEVRREADARGLRVFDATCPLVTKVHLEVEKFARQGRDTVLIGHAGHPEVEGTVGQYEANEGRRMHLVQDVADVAELELDDPDSASFVTQTTLSVDDTTRIIDALRKKFPTIEGPRKNDICYATQNRQDAVKQLALETDLILVIGSSNSSNSNRLRELAERVGVTAYLIDTADDLDAAWLDGVETVGLTSGASAPESLVRALIARLRELGANEPTDLMTVEETMEFSLPRALR
ncbi:MAG: 4-hydroxy-3-methylbut-2-enyl diphosphate reductase [Gammaproteobacteria bacterium]|nr:4-hydroxy-3-methylbut-2-enyl diphosphate reductase [Gammaproteobacteria bacterium]